jgi:hypothetical protein
LLQDLIQELVSDVIGLEVASVFLKRRPSPIFAEYGFISVLYIVTGPKEIVPTAWIGWPAWM